MSFTLRFTLGIILVLSTCSSTSNGAVAYRHTRQTHFYEHPPENLSLEDVSTSDDTSNIKKTSHANTTQENLNAFPESIKNGSIIQNKPKTENITKSYVDNNNSNIVNKDRNYIINNKLAKISVANERVEQTKNELRKVLSADSKDKQESTTDTVTKRSETTRSENGRSLDVDISKYVSDDFHNKNNEYTFSVSPDTDKYTNMQNVLPDYEHNISEFDSQFTTASYYNFEERQHTIERGIEEKLKYIDEKTAANKDIHGIEPFEVTSANLKDNLNENKDGDFNNFQTNLNYTKFRNITVDDSTNKNHVRKELDLTSGQNLDFNSSYRSEILDNLQKDYKNRIPTSDDDLNLELSSSITLDRGDVSSTVAAVVSVPKQLELSSPESVFPEILKTSHTQNDTETQKPTLSNNIELDIGNKQTKLKWKTTKPNILYLVSTANPLKTTNAGQEEELVYVPYTNDATINVSKRGSTKYTDTIKTTTESISSNKNVVSNKNRSILSNKILLTEKDNISSEPAVQENQMIPIQVVAPTNSTSIAENKTIESSTVPLKFDTELPNFLTTIKPSKALPDLDDKQTTSINDFDMLTLSTTEPSSSTNHINENEPSTSTDLDEHITTEGEAESTTKIGGNLEKSTEDITSTIDTEASTITILSEITQVTTEATDLSKYDELSTTNEVTTTENDSTDSSQTTSNVDFTRLTSPDLWAYMRGSSSTDGEDYTASEKFVTDQRTSNGRNMKTSSSYPTATHHDSTSSLALQVTSTTPNSLNITETEVIETDRTETTEEIISINTASTTEQYDSITTVTQPTNEVYNNSPTDLNFRHVSENSSYHTASSTQKQQKPYYNDSTSESTPLIIPLNPDPDNVDATTNDSNIALEEEQKEESNSGKIAAIAISCIGAVCLIILATLLFVMRKRHKRFNYGQRCTPVSLDAYSVDNVSVYNSVRRKAALRASKRSYGNLAFDDPSITSNPLNFSALVKFSSNKDAIAKEFEEVPQVTASTSELPEGCETKNRYANVIPLPETRVFLSSIDGQPNNDYINANYVTGPKSSKRYYIACQAPIQNTVDDFWKMVWEQQSKVIIMLTHLFENGNEKCVDYLPPSEVLDCHRLFGDYNVTLKKREVKEKYVISSLHLKNMVSNSWREVTHLWYLGWPEKGVPSEANSLIAFLIEARSYNKSVTTVENGKSTESNGTINSEQNPVVVHCSPGTGRTGTVIACDIAIREFELARQVDIPKTVYRIRRDRASSVQTKEQYGFIYEVITLYATKLTGGVLDSL